MFSTYDYPYWLCQWGFFFESGKTYSFTDMERSLSHLPEYKQQQLREITGIIVKAVDPEKVILFGSHATGRWVEHRYSREGITYEYISDYDILVITGPGDERKDYEVQDVIENRCIYKTPVTVIVHDIDFINKMLSEGQYFFTDIEKEGISLYDTGRVALAERRPLSPEQAQAIAQKYYDQWYGGAKQFYRSAVLNFEINQLNVAAFNLHQAAERAYNAIVLVYSGYKPKTHNLYKLKRYSKWFSEELDSIFPYNTTEEKNFFELLKRAYIDSRYKDDYMITESELGILLQRVQQLLDITETLCVGKIASF